MKKLIILSIIIFTLSANAEACLFETMAQFEKRYGKHFKEDVTGKITIRYYAAEGFYVVAQFQTTSKNGKAISVAYRTDSSGGDDKLAAKQIDYLLKLNSGGKAWRYVPTLEDSFIQEKTQNYDNRRTVEQDNFIAMKCQESSIVAVLNKTDGGLLITTPDFFINLNKLIQSK